MYSALSQLLFPIGHYNLWKVNASSLQDCIPQACQPPLRVSVLAPGWIVSHLNLEEVRGAGNAEYGLEGPTLLGLMSGLHLEDSPGPKSGTAAAFEKCLWEGS